MTLLCVNRAVPPPPELAALFDDLPARVYWTPVDGGTVLDHLDAVGTAVVEAESASHPPRISDMFRHGLSQGGIGFSLTTRAVWRLDMALEFSTAVCRLFPHQAPSQPKLELVLSEAISNAVLHGNLGLDSGLRATISGLTLFQQQIKERLADPARARRRIELCASSAPDGLTLSINDQGEGFCLAQELGRPAATSDRSGRGLSIINSLACRISQGAGAAGSSSRLDIIFSHS